MDCMKKVALGCGERNYGSEWIHVDLNKHDHIDHITDVSKLPFKDNEVDVLYASHVLEYFNREEARDVLGEWKRVLKEGGQLFVAVPDFGSMADLYVRAREPLHRFVGPLYGQMEVGGVTIYHKTVYDYASLGELLKSVGLKRVEPYDNLMGAIDDHSQARVDGELISLNLVCTK